MDPTARSVPESQVIPLSRSLTPAAMVYSLLLAMTAVLYGRSSIDPSGIDAILTSVGLHQADIPGAAILVLQHGEVLFERGYGVTDLRTRRVIDSRTNFRLASCTKQFTAMAIMLLAKDGKLKYEERLSDVFPDFPDYGKKITIRMLLNHTSGLQDYEDLMNSSSAEVSGGSAAKQHFDEHQQITDAEVLDLLKQTSSTKFPPGSRWQYSNSGYVLLGLIVQKISGKSFPDFLHDRIFAPLQMTQTVAYVRGRNNVLDRAYGHTLDDGVWKETDQSATSATLGDGGVYSSVNDLAKWDRALRHPTLLSKDEILAALTPVNVPGVEQPDGTTAQYGFGWFLNPYENHKRMWHYGETVGFRTAIQRFTDDGLTIIVLCNRADLNPTALALQIADLYFDGSDGHN